MDEQIRIALPKGRLLSETARLTEAAGWKLSDYSEGARLYHISSAGFSNLSGKILHEKDIPVQVAMGNYDLGICGLDWVQEQISKYPASALVKLRNLGYGSLELFLAASRAGEFSSLEAIRSSEKVIGIASEYPNLSESLALNCRFKRFNVYPLWGAAEIYPPENSDLVLLSCQPGQKLFEGDLFPISRVLESSAYLIANKTSLETKDLSRVLESLYININSVSEFKPGETTCWAGETSVSIMPPDSVRLALPDGHAQKHVVNILNKTSIKINDYPSTSGNRRPEILVSGVTVKVIRPQDMPLQVANNNFDAAITGKDWVREHLYQFPSSPIVEMVDLKYSWVRIVAAVHNDVPVDDTAGLREWAAKNGRRLRVASEYVRIADKYARDNHLGRYRIIPTWGATEAFLPDDADILIENTETGGTLKRHNLKIIETLFESTACLIANTSALKTAKAATIKSIASILEKAVQEK